MNRTEIEKLLEDKRLDNATANAVNDTLKAFDKLMNMNNVEIAREFALKAKKENAKVPAYKRNKKKIAYYLAKAVEYANKETV
tara:strand:+ start:603 stop:851 length:249 start_codon:yes stop_codon:yes gene_type:complete